ncbi:LLM class flavin-dependent oxidoreductase [Actinomycetospora endophytica]|uniref:LLM class flavin-dependent oxidoreductase n=1 Tax=Actinomycetospora endophytica TaxID=2291215 RepID=A0ABS8PJ36_9PSEU|nr:LLM class flavin-dependent oxidoreductase [Actinomycetospora endophytica]MCD2198169.1 LLM class flavin-dependent oxidoreductase [Actinomycetospora endophytica]
MRLGATLVHLSPAPPYATAEWARRLVGAGFESLWTPEIIGRGFLVPDPFVTLAAAATVTEDVELGTATLQVPLHHPADLAHRILSLAAVCGDRLTLGVSPGSTKDDYDALERDHAGRFRVFRENVTRLRGLLADGRDEDADLALPTSAAAGTSLLLGSWGANVERAAREFDGWLASGYRSTVDEIVAAHDRYRAAGGGRAIVCAVPVSGGDLGPTGEALARYADAGFDDAVVLIEPGGPDPERVRALFTQTP